MKKRLLLLMLSACALCTVSLKYLGNTYDLPQHNMEVGKETVETEEPQKRQETVEEQTLQEQMETQNAKVLYAYACLDEEDQAAYREIYEILAGFKKEQPISLTDTKRIADVFQCVMNDHPEIFYVQGYTYTRYLKGDITEKITLSGTYTCDELEAGRRKEQIENYVTACLSGMEPGMTDYEIVKYIYDYVINHTQYDQSALDNQNICSVFLYGKSVCQGYAKAMQYLLNRAGIFCTLVIGSVSNGEGHAWDLVKMDGNFYYVDPTWGDASYQMVEGNADIWKQEVPSINYDYLGVTTAQLLKTHCINNVVPMPYCVSLDCNYYVKEGTYLTVCSEEELRALFDEKMQSQNGYVTLKCSDEEVYAQVRNLLISGQRIFDYIHRADGVVAYSDNETQLSLSFWLTNA